MSQEQFPKIESLSIVETNKTMEQLFAEMDVVNAREREIRAKYEAIQPKNSLINAEYSGELKKVIEEKENIFAQIRYINSKLEQKQ